jgi:hypothetical protein
MNSEHSTLPPSSAARRMACPGSREMELKFPAKEESVFAREGIAAHWVANCILEGDTVLEGTITPNNEIVTREMIEGANLYNDTIQDIINKAEVIHDLRRNSLGKIKLHIEEKIEINNIHPSCWGTPDCWFIKNDILYIFDYKFGHAFVEVFENWQLLEYACGIFDSLTLTERLHTKIIKLWIIQPRNYNSEGQTREWVIGASELAEYQQKLIESEYLSMQPLAPKISNSLACSNCRARHACPELQQAANTYVDVIAKGAYELSNTEVGHELRYLKEGAALLDARITGLEEQAIYEIKNGRSIPFFRLELSQGREKWTIPAEQVVTLGKLYDKDLSKPIDVITPKQAIAKGLDPKVVNSIAERTFGAMKLVPEDTKKLQKLFNKTVDESVNK